MIVNLLTRILDYISVQGVGGDFEMNIKLLNGNVLDMLKTIADESVDCVVSSPPYYGLRSYKGADTIWGGNPDCEHEWVGYIRKGQNGGKNSDKLNIKKSNEQNFQMFEDQKQNICHKCGAWKGQLGLESTHQIYIDHMMLVMKELKRVLKKTGTLFWNMGDSYAGDMGSRAGWQDSKYSESREEGINNGEAVFLKADYGNIQAKSLMMIPERFAMAMIDDGWILRNKIIWYKCLGSSTQLYVKTSTGTFRTNVKDLYKIKGEKHVYGTKGWVKITNFVKNPMSDMFTIHLRNGMRIEVTPEHRFPLEDGRLLYANDLKKGDKIAHTRLPDNEGSELGTYDNGYIVGMYLAEGSKTERMIQFSLNVKEDYIANKIRSFTIKYAGTFGEYDYGNKKSVHISGKVPISIIDHYVSAYGAKNKHLSSHAFNENNIFLQGVLDGYLDGDGHYEKENDRYRLNFTLNRELEYDLRLICNRLGYNMRAFLSHATETKSGKSFPTIHGEIRKKKSGHHNQKDDYEIMRIERTKGVSYEIEVDSEDHLFTLIDGTLTHNSNGMPSSVKDRLSNKWEYVFFFTKSQKYYFNLDSIRKPLEESSIKRISQKNILNQFKSGKSVEFAKTDPVNNIPKIVNNMHQKYQQDGSYQGSHSGYFNDDGSLRANLSGANPGDVVVPETVEFFRQKGQGGNFDYGGINSENGSHYNQHGANPGDVINQPAVRHKSWASNPGHTFTHERKYDPDADGGDFFDIPTRAHSFAHFAVFPETLVEPLIKAGCPSKGTVLDPFAGSGTVGVVAMKQEKNAILVEISPEYCNIIKKRLNWGIGLGIEYEHVVGEALK